MPDASLLPKPSSPEEVKARNAQRHELLRRLDSKQPGISAQAIEECRNLTASEIRALLRMADETRKPMPQRTQRWGVIVILLGLIFFFFLTFYVHSVDGFLTGTFFTFVLILTCMSTFETRRLYSVRLKDSLAVIVANAQDPALLPEALRVLNSMRPIYSQDMTPLRQALFDKSVFFLQKLDIAQIRSYGIQQQALCLFLEPDIRHKLPQTALRVLNYLERYGTSSALSQVSGIANARPSRQVDMQVRDAALTCLAALQQRTRESSQRQMLLRAAAAPAPDSDALLRPVPAQVSPLEPAMLLRPTDSWQSSPPISGKIINGNSET